MCLNIQRSNAVFVVSIKAVGCEALTNTVTAPISQLLRDAFSLNAKACGGGKSSLRGAAGDHETVSAWAAGGGSLRRAWGLPPGTEANFGFVSSLRRFLCLHFGSRRDLRYLRRRPSQCRPGRDLALGDRGHWADLRRPRHRTVRGPHSPDGLVLSMGVAARQSGNRLVVRSLELLLPRHRRGGGGQRTRQSGAHALARHGARRADGPVDHLGDPAGPGRADHRVHVPRRPDQRDPPSASR